MISRKKFLLAVSALAGVGVKMPTFATSEVPGSHSAGIVDPHKLHFPYVLDPLPYPADALEPYLDTETMNLHHGKHHAAYVNNLNKALEQHPQLQQQSLADLLQNLESLPESLHNAVLNNGGGHLNHAIFWKIMSPTPLAEPSGAIAKALDEEFGGLSAVKEKLLAAALSVFGSGWAWLVADTHGKLMIKTYPNQNPPLLDGFFPLVGIDVWEHSYYLKFQNRRADFVKSFFEVLDWSVVSKAYDQLTKF